MSSAANLNHVNKAIARGVDVGVFDQPKGAGGKVKLVKKVRTTPTPCRRIYSSPKMTLHCLQGAAGKENAPPASGAAAPKKAAAPAKKAPTTAAAAAPAKKAPTKVSIHLEIGCCISY